MSMRGQIISEEYNKMVWVHDKEGHEYACYAKDIDNPQAAVISKSETKKCLDLSLVLGDSW